MGTTEGISSTGTLVETDSTGNSNSSYEIMPKTGGVFFPQEMEAAKQHGSVRMMGMASRYREVPVAPVKLEGERPLAAAFMNTSSKVGCNNSVQV